MLAVIDYNAGNVSSVLFALKRLGAEATLTQDPAAIRAAGRVIFPGVGEASSTMRYLRKHGLDDVIRELTQPVLGICLGMQLLCEYSEENDTPCLGIIPQQVVRFRPQQGEKTPHVGWNCLREVQEPMFSNQHEGEFVYFVHGYYVEVGPYTVAVTDYIISFSSAVRKDNFFATQFHPEKSGKVGEQILKRFLEIDL